MSVAARRRSQPRRAVVSKEFHSCLLCLVGAPARRRAVCCSRSLSARRCTGCVFAEPRTNGGCKTTLRQCRSPARGPSASADHRCLAAAAKGACPRCLLRTPAAVGCSVAASTAKTAAAVCTLGGHGSLSVRLGCQVFRSALIGWTNARVDWTRERPRLGCLLGSRSICRGTPMAICFHADQPMHWSIYSAWRW